MLFDVFLGDETNTTLPAWGRVVEDVEDLEAIGMNVEEHRKVIFQEDVFLIDVGVDEAEGSLVKGVLEGSTDDLDHGGDASTTGDHANVIGKVGGILEVTLGTFDADLVTDLESRKVTGDVAFFVRLWLR